ncbi:ethanolamine ammonia-lyase subunit EutB [Chelatococcus sp. GCM10030263]|uniref:ethanolamine ammonia-lyase subunit EutB n=1 Tax=Chelatococcus sp. GCM10030263 TaxID=3273387 RepID=UPI003605C653
MPYRHTVGQHNWTFEDLKALMAKATPVRSGDVLAGIAAESAEEGWAAKMCLADVPLKTFLTEALVPYEEDEVTRLILDTHDGEAFRPIAHLTVGEFRDWLLSDLATPAALAGIAPGVTPEMAAAVSKLMRNQDLILVARKCRVVRRFRNTIGLPGTMAVRLQPNHPTDDPRGISASIVDGLLYGCGDAVIGVNPASDSLPVLTKLLHLLDDLIQRYEIPTQACVLTHVTTSIDLIGRGVPVDLVFQSVAGTEAANRSFGIDLAVLKEGMEAGRSLKRGSLGQNVMYFETGQGSALSAGAHHGVDQQTLEARAYAVCRPFEPLLVNTVVGFIGPEYLYDGKQIIRAGLEDHFCGKLMGLPLGCDVCYTNHAEADQDDMDTLLTLLAAAGVTFIIGVPGADDVMLNYQSTSFHDQAYIREVMGLRRAPEFEAWLGRMGITDVNGRLLPQESRQPLLAAPAFQGIAE